MSSMFQFLYISLFEYWGRWVTGTGFVGLILFLLNLYEKRRIEKGGKPMTWKQNALILFCAFWFFATFSAWHDGDKNLRAVIGQRQKDTSDLAVCSSDLRAEKIKSDFLDTQTKNQQAIVNGNQQTLTAQQGTLNSQQLTLNTCVVKLAELSANIPQKTTKVMYSDDPQVPPPAKHMSMLMLLTNKPNTPVKFLLRCSPNVSLVTASIPGGGAMVGGTTKLRDGVTWDIGISLPPWGPESPLMVKMFYDQDQEPLCQLHPL